MKAGRQTTLGARATVSGIGVHSGQPVSITFHPADANTGVVFVRLDAQGRPEREVRAHAHYVAATELATVLGDAASGPCVSTIEHIMATLCGLGVDNAIIEIDGAEAPIMDGSAAAFVAAIDQAGIVALRRAAPLHQGFEADPRAEGRLLRRVDALRARLPRRRHDRFPASADRPAVDRPRSRGDDVPPRSGARAHLRLHEGRLPAVGRRLRARRLDRQHAGARRRPPAQSRKGCASPTSSCATRRSMRSAIWRLPARRCSARTSRSRAAIGSITRSWRAVATTRPPGRWSRRRPTSGHRACAAMPT